MDRKTLLGLITGACMLGLVLFFGGMLVGAGLFMGPDAPQTSENAAGNGQMELLAQNSAPRVQTDITPKNLEQTDPMAGAGGAAEQNAPTGDMPSMAAPRGEAAQGVDPVGDLIAEKSTSETDGDTDVNVPDVPDMGDMQPPQKGTTDTAAGTDNSGAATTPATTSNPTPQNTKAGPAKPAAPEIRKDSKPPKPASQTDTAAKTPTPAKPAASETAASAALHREPGSKNMPYSIQVGAFKVDANARQRAEELRKKGLEVAVVERGSNDGAWYYVRVGAYPDATTARTGAEKVKKDTGIDGFPVRAEPNDKTID
ncbi:SPOR domain-containing protein [Thalassospira mesophila]|uniref:SPOR domain-containing protein n=1 Tax=Thalassospira mesophila TaxID=1293891 RepID=A0A1Y2KYQ9_9PROT|nr:SPOR domain-containing protein [Thalassospira mesophila]OSQ37249.1 hypothetical protein TMES_15805 [Thalassospira mesophila]